MGPGLNGAGIPLDMDPHGFVDAGWSRDPDTLQSTSRHIFISNQGVVNWASKCQTIVALSSDECKYIRFCYTRQHLAWLQTLGIHKMAPQSYLDSSNTHQRYTILGMYTNITSFTMTW